MREWERARLSADNSKAQSTAKQLHLQLQNYIMEHTEHGKLLEMSVIMVSNTIKKKTEIVIVF